MSRWMPKFLAAVGALGLWIGASAPVQAAGNEPPLPRMYYYPYSYFPHNYWPAQSPQYPEPKGHPYVKPPAYMAYPAFREPGWRYDALLPRPPLLAGPVLSWDGKKRKPYARMRPAFSHGETSIICSAACAGLPIK